MRKIFSLVFFVSLFLSHLDFAHSVGKVLPPINNETAMPVAGRDAANNAVPLSVDAGGNLNITVNPPATTLLNFITTVAAAGVNDRTQVASHAVNSCTIQGFITNTGAVYVGGPAVTNAAGANRGIRLDLGESMGPITVSNSNSIYISADNANDKVSIFCI